MTTEEHEAFAEALRVAFIEIRAAEDLEEAQRIADAFHNAPAQLSVGKTYAEIKRNVLDRAERHGMRNRLELWWKL